MSSKFKEKILHILIFIVSLFLTFLIPIKSLFVEAIVCGFALSFLMGIRLKMYQLFFGIFFLLLSIIFIDLARILTSELRIINYEIVYESFLRTMEYIIIYFSTGFLNFALVVKEFGFFGLGGNGLYTSYTLLDILNYFATGDRLISREGSEATDLGGIYLPMISEGVNIYSAFLPFYMDFGIVGIFAYYLFLAGCFYIFINIFRKDKLIAIGLTSIFFGINIFSIAWSLKLFHIRLILWCAVYIFFVFLYKIYTHKYD